MTSVTLPESGLETIGEKAFMGCEKLLSITIPKSVTTIKERAFLYCQALGGVTVGWTEARFIPAISELEYVFFSPSDHQSKVLHVPAGTAEMYLAKDVWKKFFIMAGKTARGCTGRTTTEPRSSPSPVRARYRTITTRMIGLGMLS